NRRGFLRLRHEKTSGRPLRSRGGVARVRANTYDAPLKPTDHAAHTERLGLMARRGHFLMALDRNRETTALRRSPT
ncbi:MULTISPECIES: hypothetical protein, partial [Burkholderia]